MSERSCLSLCILLLRESSLSACVPSASIAGTRALSLVYRRR